MTEPHIVIIGGGFSGAALAIHLARHADFALRATVVEPRAALGQGVAYSTPEPSHRINVPAARMYLCEAERGDFDRWYRRQPEFAQDPDARWHDDSVYPQRSAFGRYVAEKFAAAARRGPARLRHLRDRALRLEEGLVITERGATLAADAVVLAVSHPPPALPAPLRPLAGHPALIADPWRETALDAVAADDRVAIVGTGLTMADVSAALHRRGHRGPLLAFSRHGLLSRPNFSGETPPWPLAIEAFGARGVLAQIRAEVRRAAAEGVPWQAVLDEARAGGQRLWQQWPPAEQRRFLRHLRSWWDAHRYRIAPQAAQVIDERRAHGGFRALAARLQTAAAADGALILQLRRRYGGEETVTADRLIVTTGPAHADLTDSQPLLRDLTLRGLIRPDALGLGLLVNADSQAVGRDGIAATFGDNRRLWVAGPAARGRFGELMGLPQVAEHAEAVARQLLTALRAARRPARCPVSF
ncbi:FAD/NAD(P)-binding protein [Brenneria populi]|uniref:FAD/NAD(P)-binding protein n=1 Tax=Brenneria populi TaxID=1505588 RepID=A0ABU6JQD5_9GAMM|nr:FAD/NAD(P)-binding protein [Brenneria populi Li et al. 2015]